MNNPSPQKLSQINADRNYKKFVDSQSFTARKLTDTPTDDLSVVNRKYVNLNGPTTGRPTSSIVGQFYFDNDLGKPVWWDGSTFVDATGSSA